MKRYTQLTQIQRYQIYVLKLKGHFLVEIAEVVGVNKSTISREIRRNQSQRGYRPQWAQHLAKQRRRKCQPMITEQGWAQVEQLLRQEWSPEQISGRLKQEHSFHISHEWIYQHILKDRRAGGDLYRHLRCQRKRRKRYGIYDRRGQLSNCTSIEERPAVVAGRKRLGDWEVDTILGNGHQQAIVSLTERKSRFSLLGNVTPHTAQAVQDEVVRLLLPLVQKVHTLTSDHGKEFACHQQIADQLHLKFYFAHPYSAWERGTNENTNGLIRQYFPKQYDFKTISSSEVEHVTHKLNLRPRKSLRYQTPFEVFFRVSVALVT